MVVPTLNSEARVARAHAALRSALDLVSDDAEIVLVDDGSTDRTWELIESIAAEDPDTVGLRLGANVGQIGALCAGFSEARGDIVVMMDDDGDADPLEVRRLVDEVASGADFVGGWRSGRRGPVRSTGSWLFNRRVRMLGSPFHDAGCGLNAMTSDVARRISSMGWDVRYHRLKLAVTAMDLRVAEVRFDVRPTDDSHYGLRRLAAAWLDTEIAYGPLSAIGAAAGVTAVAASTVVAGARLAARPQAADRVAGSLLAAGGAAAGLGAAMVLQTWWTTERRSHQDAPFEIVRTTPRALPHGSVGSTTERA